VSHWAIALSINAVTFNQLEVACRHVDELMATGMTKNLAIRNLQEYVNRYGKMRELGRIGPDDVGQYELWSKEALAARAANHGLKSGQYMRIEHGTPRRQIARLVPEKYHKGELTREWMDDLCARMWRVAVVTHEEDSRLNHLNRLARRPLYADPAEHWAAAGIEIVTRNSDLSSTANGRSYNIADPLLPRNSTMASPAIPSIQLYKGTYREALWEVLCASIGRFVPVLDLPDPVGRGDDPEYASKQLNKKLARASGELEVHQIGTGKDETFGLFETAAPKTAGIRVPVLSRKRGPAYDPQTKRFI
jgi:hypothetical protein